MTNNTRSTRSLLGRPAEQTRTPRLAALSVMAIAGIYCGVLIGAMLITWLSDTQTYYPVSASRDDLEALLKHDPGSADLRGAIRREDQRLIENYLTRRRRLEVGAWMLLGGLVVFFGAGLWYGRLDAKLPRPSPAGEEQDEPWFGPARQRWAAAAVLLLLAASAVAVLAHFGGEPFPAAVAPDNPQQAVPPPPDYKDNWPAFRGPTMMGIAPDEPFPVTWDEASGKNVAWTTPVPAPGNSSPVVWGDRIFLTGGDKKRQVLMCFSRVDGRLLWQTTVASDVSRKRFRGQGEPIEPGDDTGYAAPTPVTDGKRVYVAFASNDLGAVDFDGKVVWVRNLGAPHSMYGLASSPALAEGQLVYQLDQSETVEENESFLYGLDPKTGDTLWQQPRPVASSWASPVVVKAPKRTLILTCSQPWVIAHEPGSGMELWRCGGLANDVAASPVYADGLVFVANANAKAMAIRTGGDGDVTDTHVAWSYDEGLPDTVSPLATDKYFLEINGGNLTVLDAKTGKVKWKQELPAWFIASPTRAGDRVWLLGEGGKCFVFKLGDAYRQVGTGTLKDKLHASPAFCDGFIYIRGAKKLYCIAQKD